MADEWIKWVKGLSRRREVLAMARTLNKDPKIIACTCMEVWEWADENTSDGVVVGVTAGDIDRHAGIRRFAQAMQDVGWLTVGDEGVQFPRWDRHNGTSAKSRALDKERKRKARLCPENVQDLSGSKADKNRTRGEERREEERKDNPDPSQNTHSPALTGDAGSQCVREEAFDCGPIGSKLLDEFWRHYPRKIGRGAAYPEMEAAIRRVQAERGTDVRGAWTWLLARVKVFARSGMVTRGPAQFIPSPERWFREERYADDDGAWEAGDAVRLTEPRAIDALAEWDRQAGGAA